MSNIEMIQKFLNDKADLQAQINISDIVGCLLWRARCDFNQGFPKGKVLATILMGKYIKLYDWLLKNTSLCFHSETTFLHR